jgi:hypothetical protein
MARVTAAQKAAAEAVAKIEADEAQQAAEVVAQMEVIEEAPIADLDTPAVSDGIEEDQQEVEEPQDEVEEPQDESQDEAMPEDPGTESELIGKYSFSAEKLEEYLRSDKQQDKIIQESRGGNFVSITDHTVYVPISLFIE